jgi:hypothetical protein
MQFTLQFALLFRAKGANLTEEIGDLFFGLGLHSGFKIQEKGFGVKD